MMLQYDFVTVKFIKMLENRSSVYINVPSSAYNTINIIAAEKFNDVPANPFFKLIL